MTTGLGKELRTIRKSHGFSLRDLARRTNLSSSYLSQIENEHVSPSLSSLVRIADALDTTIQRLFEELMTPEGHAVIRREERRRIDCLNNGAKASFLTNSVLSRRFEAVQISLAPGAHTGDDGVYERSGSLLMLVLDGRVRATLGEAEYDLHKGDSLNMESRASHFVKNTNDGPSEILFIVVPER